MPTRETRHDAVSDEHVVVSPRLLYTPKQTAGALRIGRSKLYELLREGELEPSTSAQPGSPHKRSMSSSNTAEPPRRHSDDLPDINYDATERDDMRANAFRSTSSWFGQAD